jgi:hypothetical protein
MFTLGIVAPFLKEKALFYRSILYQQHCKKVENLEIKSLNWVYSTNPTTNPTAINTLDKDIRASGIT